MVTLALDAAQTADAADAAEEAAVAALQAAGAAAAQAVRAGDGVAALGHLQAGWRARLDSEVLPHLRVAYHCAAMAAEQALVADAAAGGVLVADAAGDYLQGARNRLVGVADPVWERARAALVDGMAHGEGVEQLAARVTEATELGTDRARVIARTEALGASNAGAIAAVRAAGVGGRKTWVATRDDRVRPSHELADGQTVPLEALFTVGGWPMDRPHDPAGPPEEVINCRCSVSFDLDVAAVAGSATPAAVFHLPGRHRQKSHGHDRPGPGRPRLPDRPDIAPDVDVEVGGWIVAEAERLQIEQQAAAKITDAPVPSAAAVAKAQAELAAARAGRGRAGGQARGGSAADRRRQRRNLFAQFGGHDRGYVACHGCGTKTHWADPGSDDNPSGLARFERGKIFVKCQGGGYQLPNLLPECFGCNRNRGDKPLRSENEC
jgi:Phage Mu protein F like protein